VVCTPFSNLIIDLGMLVLECKYTDSVIFSEFLSLFLELLIRHLFSLKSHYILSKLRFRTTLKTYPPILSVKSSGINYFDAVLIY
jgi:hypothetical protein